MDADVILQRGETCHDKPDWIRRELCIMSLSGGIERKEIVKDDHDRQNFVYRLGTIALETGTLIYAWTLMTKHIHIFLIRFRLYFDMGHLTSGVPPTPCRMTTIGRARYPIEPEGTGAPATANRTPADQ